MHPEWLFTVRIQSHEVRVAANRNGVWAINLKDLAGLQGTAPNSIEKALVEHTARRTTRLRIVLDKDTYVCRPGVIDLFEDTDLSNKLGKRAKQTQENAVHLLDAMFADPDTSQAWLSRIATPAPQPALQEAPKKQSTPLVQPTEGCVRGLCIHADTCFRREQEVAQTLASLLRLLEGQGVNTEIVRKMLTPQTYVL